MESGIDNYVRGQTIDLYKAVRSKWFKQRIKADMHVEDVTDEGLSSERILFLLILICGHTMAGIAFAMELIWDSGCLRGKSMRTIPKIHKST